MDLSLSPKPDREPNARSADLAALLGATTGRAPDPSPGFTSLDGSFNAAVAAALGRWKDE